MNVTNRSKTPVGIPGNTLLEPGESRFILNWDAVKDNRVIRQWLSRGILTVDTPRAAQPAPSQVSEDVEKDALIARLKERGIVRNKRTSVEKLRALLADAEG